MPDQWSQPFSVGGDRGEAVVLLHGFTGHPGHWITLRETLVERGFTVVAPLLSGHGSGFEALSGSAWREWVESGRVAVEAVASHRHVHLVGLSMGGLIAILLAGSSAASSLTTVNTPVLLREAKAYLAPLARHLVPYVAAPGEPVPDPDLCDLWVTEERRSTAAVDQLLRMIWHAWRASGRLRRPTLVIQSSTDQTVRPSSGRLLAKRLDASLRWVETRHNALLDPRREEVFEAIVTHLESATGPDGR